MATKSVIISVERLLEQEVDEINRDGEEKYIKPFDYSEELTHLAQKIDFYEGIQGHDSDLEDKGEEDKDDKLKKEEDAKNGNEWHWSSVHSKLRLALSEMSIMLDVLQTLNKKRYLILDPIQQSPEQEKQTVQMLEKRNYLVKVGTYIGKGAAALGTEKKPLVKSEPIVIDVKDSSKSTDYYTQLMELRQFWRVKKSGSQIAGDLSYRTSGSRFWHPGVFEVKIDDENDESSDKTSEKTKKLQITVSPDLAKTSEIIVQVFDGTDNEWKAVSIPTVLEDNFVNSWEKDMSKAQQHLFNKEIFSQLSNDAFQGSFLGIDVLNSQIRCKLPDNAEVVITHNVDSSTPVDTQTETKETSNDLTFLLSALLYQQHRNVSKFSTPYPATSNFYGKQSKSSSVVNIIHRKPNEVGKSILYEFIKQTEHKLWVRRVNDFLYKENLQILEPTIGFHWNVLKSRLKSVLTINLSTRYLHKSIFSSFVVVIDEKGFNIYSKDVIDIDLPFDMELLNLVIKNSIYKHLQSVVEVLAKQHGWVLVTPKMGNNLLAPINSSNVTLLLKSFCQDKFVELKLNDMRNIEVQASKNAPSDNLSLDEDFKELKKVKFNVSWSSLPGNSFVDKLQAVMIFC